MPREQWGVVAGDGKNDLARATSTWMIYFMFHHDYNANGWGKLKNTFSQLVHGRYRIYKNTSVH